MLDSRETQRLRSDDRVTVRCPACGKIDFIPRHLAPPHAAKVSGPRHVVCAACADDGVTLGPVS